MGFFVFSRGIVGIGSVQLRNGTLLFDSTTVPTNGTSGTGAGRANPGSRCFVTNGDEYVNTGTKASPVWTNVPSGSVSPSSSKSPSASASVSVSPSASVSPS